MKKILHFLLISFFSFNIISCDTTTILLGAAGGGAAYWYKDDITKWYDDFSKESASVADETDETDLTEETSADAEGISSLFVSVGGKGTIITSSNGTKWTRRTSGTKAKLRAVTYGNDTLVAVGFSGIILTS